MPEWEYFEFPFELLCLVNALLLDDASYTSNILKRSQPSGCGASLQSKRIHQGLKDIINQRLRSYKTTLAQDVQLLSNSLPRRHRMAVEVRLGEKRVLASALAALSDKLGKFVSDGELTQGDHNIRRLKI